MSSIITCLLLYNQYLQNQISYLLLFIATRIPIRQMAFDEWNDIIKVQSQAARIRKIPQTDMNTLWIWLRKVTLIQSTTDDSFRFCLKPSKFTLH